MIEASQTVDVPHGQTLETTEALLAGPVTSVAQKRTVKPVKVSRTLSSGARLIRDRNGHRHMVEVGVGGFLFEEPTYRSLTAIAAGITGAHWSGPRFFGL